MVEDTRDTSIFPGRVALMDKALSEPGGVGVVTDSATKLVTAIPSDVAGRAMPIRNCPAGELWGEEGAIIVPLLRSAE